MVGEADALYFDYLDRLYARFNLSGRSATLSELIPQLDMSQRDTLTHLMWAAVYTWRGLTDEASDMAAAESEAPGDE